MLLITVMNPQMKKRLASSLSAALSATRFPATALAPDVSVPDSILPPCRQRRRLRLLYCLTVYYRRSTQIERIHRCRNQHSWWCAGGPRCALGLMIATEALAGAAQRTAFGTLPDGTLIEAITLTNGHGIRARIITFGATLQALEAPDRSGHMADVALGYDDLVGYVEHPDYFGATIGRYANRIAGGRFSLDGRQFQLSQNDKENSLHGGAKGFDKRVWKILDVRGGPTPTVSLGLTSAAGRSGLSG